MGPHYFNHIFFIPNTVPFQFLTPPKNGGKNNSTQAMQHEKLLIWSDHIYILWDSSWNSYLFRLNVLINIDIYINKYFKKDNGKFLKLKIFRFQKQGYRDGSEFKSTNCSFRGLRFDSQHMQKSLIIVTAVPGHWMGCPLLTSIGTGHSQW